MEQTVPYWFAFVLCIGSLIYYLCGAIWSRLAWDSNPKERRYDFNLGLPKIGTKEFLFATSLIAGGTSLSTVFVFFLTATPVYGLWVILCPLFFGLGTYISCSVYKRAEERGYFKENEFSRGSTGLVPTLGERLTGSRTIGWILVALSFINLLAVLVLELVVAVEVFGYLSEKTFGTMPSSFSEFAMFAISVVFLFSYVFIGGFRAVVFSDIWQMKAMKSTVMLLCLSLIVLVVSRATPLNLKSTILSSPSALVLIPFVINVILGNLFIPLSQESSWQRFRAFGFEERFDFRRAVFLSIRGSVILWSGLIIASFLIILSATPEAVPTLTSMRQVLEVVQGLNNWWFPFFIFPLLAMASLSAMYSTADTCVAGILYLLEYSMPAGHESRGSLPTRYYIAMFLIFLLSLGCYGFVRVWFNPTVLQLIFSVFSNLVVVAPMILTVTCLRPVSEFNSKRTFCVLCSLAVGFVLYWGGMLTSFVIADLRVSQLSILLGLIGSALPMIPLWVRRDI